MTRLWIGPFLVAMLTASGCTTACRFPESAALRAMERVKICQDAYREQHGHFGSLAALANSCEGVPDTDSGAFGIQDYKVELRLSADRQEYRLYSAPAGMKFFYRSSEDKLKTSFDATFAE